jgi:protein-S-isoprenylcysteine O-methyltransferase Ste14
VGAATGLVVLSVLWLALELLLSRRKFAFEEIRNPGWVRFTRGLWLLGPWVCVLDIGAPHPFALVLGYLGLGLRAAAVRKLGRDFTYGTGAPALSDLSTTGVYRYLRHPSFSGLLLLTNLLGLLTGSLWGALLLLSTVPNVVFRLEQEERELERRYGDTYRLYKQRTFRLIPLLY